MFNGVILCATRDSELLEVGEEGLGRLGAERALVHVSASSTHKAHLFNVALALWSARCKNASWFYMRQGGAYASIKWYNSPSKIEIRDQVFADPHVPCRLMLTALFVCNRSVQTYYIGIGEYARIGCGAFSRLMFSSVCWYSKYSAKILGRP